MLNRFKTALFNAVSGLEPLPATTSLEERDEDGLASKFPYSRPSILNLQTMEEVKVSADHHVRPIIVPRDMSAIPYQAGYAECVNAGKSQWNEDQAAVQRRVLRRPAQGPEAPELPYVYFGLFDGHAGVGAALAAANQLHHIVHEKLIDVLDELLPQLGAPKEPPPIGIPMLHRAVSRDALVIGALEAAFWEMDQLIAEDRERYKGAGGCTALVALLLLGKLYVSNAGDSRAVLCQALPVPEPQQSSDVHAQTVNGTEALEPEIDMMETLPLSDVTPPEISQVLRQPVATPMSHDFTPESERSRVRSVAALQPQLLGGEFTPREYARRPSQRDLGRRILYREASMAGWAYKTLTHQDLRIPIVTGEGKRSRVMGTIGVTRGFGDHDLKALNTKIAIKPFLTPQPEVMILDLTSKCSTEEAETDSDPGVLVMGTDGLWDVTDNQRAAEVVQRSLAQFKNERHRFTSAAQDLVAASRGKLVEHRAWRTSEGRPATIDDISVFVIPLAPYRDEYAEWKQKYETTINEG